MPDPNQVKKYKITVDGKEEEVEATEEDIVAGLQMKKDYTNKTTVVAKQLEQLKQREKQVEALESIINEMEVNPQLKEALNKTYADVKAGRISKTEGDTKSLKIVDKWVKNAETSEDRKAYEELREAIHEETNIGGILNELKVIKDELASLKLTSHISFGDRINQDLQKLDDELGKEFVDKYREKVTSLALKYPNQTVRESLFYLASKDEDLEKALLAKAEKKKQLELDRKKKGSSPGGEEFVGELPKYEKDKRGVVTQESLLERIKKKAGMS